MPRDVLPCLVLSCLDFTVRALSCLALPCLACIALPFFLTSCLILSCLVFCSFTFVPKQPSRDLSTNSTASGDFHDSALAHAHPARPSYGSCNQHHIQNNAERKKRRRNRCVHENKTMVEIHGSTDRPQGRSPVKPSSTPRQM